MEFSFELLSKTNKKFNEDIIGAEKDCAWVLDGATGYYKNRIPEYSSEAQWYVKEWNKYLKYNINNKNKDIRQILSDGIEYIKQKYISLTGEINNTPKETFPTSAIAVVRKSGEYIEYFVLGDCVIITDNLKEQKIITDDRVGKLEAKVIEEIIKIQKEEKLNIKEAREKVMPLLKKNRSMKNTANGYWVLEFDKKAVDNGIYGRLKTSEVKNIALMSDGFFRIIDTFNYYKCDRFFEDLNEYGLNYIWNKIDMYEKDDNNCIKYPRTKQFDDSSIIYIK